MNIFVPEFLCQKARDKYEQFGRQSRGVPLIETPGSVLQWSTTTPGAERYVNRPVRRDGDGSLSRKARKADAA